jgi:hypothetical protein
MVNNALPFSAKWHTANLQLVMPRHTTHSLGHWVSFHRPSRSGAVCGRAHQVVLPNSEGDSLKSRSGFWSPCELGKMSPERGGTHVDLLILGIFGEDSQLYLFPSV